MIKINLLAERKPAKVKTAPGLKVEGSGGPQNLLLVAILLVGVLVAAGLSWKYTKAENEAHEKIEQANAELERLKESLAKGQEFEDQKTLLARKIDLITALKKQQAVPVYIMDQVSRNLPEFLWLDSMSATQNSISVSGKATTYNAVSNFYTNLTDSGYFQEVALGRIFQVQEGVAFSLTCRYVGREQEVAEPPQG